MKDFVNISTLFKVCDERSIESLAGIYTNYHKLLRQIECILNKHLNESNIKGKKVLLKPNWVTHSSREYDEICLRTNDNFLIATLEVILKKKPASIIIGDAPIQGAIWDKIVRSQLVCRINKLSEEFQIPVVLKDFRRKIFYPWNNKIAENIKPNSDYIIFDTKEKSFLEPITDKTKQRFRVTNYSPERLSNSHKTGTHKYCITKELFEADILLSLPKIKTHQKVGITGALKNIVGLNGDKDFLPHHRLGGTGFGGDCYPGKNYLRFWSELVLDRANRKVGEKSYSYWTKFAIFLWKLSFPKSVHSIEAGWFGNDTTWRMVMDLNQIVEYGKSDGSISDSPQRRIYSLCDAVIVGHGDGPLNPDPLPLGIISFTNNSAINDRLMAILMGFQPEKIPLLNHGSVDLAENCEITLNGEKIKIRNLKEYSIDGVPPKGWREFLMRKI